jgi:hypothetical protein
MEISFIFSNSVVFLVKFELAMAYSTHVRNILGIEHELASN